MMNKIKGGYMKACAKLVAAIVLLTPLSAHALSQWTAAGVTGSIASYNIRIGFTGSGTVAYQIAGGNGAGMSYFNSSNSGTDPFTVVYNVTSSEIQPLWTTLTIGYSGVVSGASIVATLYQVTPATGGRTALCSATSTSFTSLQSCTFSSSSLDFSSYAYYVEAIVDRSSSSQLPTINYVSIN
jgi:hypothetical protein